MRMDNWRKFMGGYSWIAHICSHNAGPGYRVSYRQHRFDSGIDDWRFLLLCHQTCSDRYHSLAHLNAKVKASVLCPGFVKTQIMNSEQKIKMTEQIKVINMPPIPRWGLLPGLDKAPPFGTDTDKSLSLCLERLILTKNVPHLYFQPV